MSHITPVTGDPAVRVPIILRKARNAVLVFDFVDADGNDIPIGEGAFADDTFIVKIRVNDRALNNLLELTDGNGLQIVDGNIQLEFTEENSDIDHYKCFFELINTFSGQNWYASPIFFNTGEPIEDTTTQVQSTINLGSQIIRCTISLQGFDITDFIDQLLFIVQYDNGEGVYYDDPVELVKYD
jgi:hypothetical protein